MILSAVTSLRYSPPRGGKILHRLTADSMTPTVGTVNLVTRHTSYMPRRWDRRSALVGSVGTGLVVFLFILAQYGEPTVFELLETVVVAPLAAGIPAGVIVGILTDDSRSAFLTGGLAACFGTVLGLSGYALFEAATVSNWTIAERLDILFLIGAYSGAPLAMVSPLVFFGGGTVAALVVRWGRSTEEPVLHDLSE